MTPLLDKGIDPAPRWTRIDFALVAGLLLVSLALRLPGLNQGLWFDEIWTLVDFVRLPAGEIISEFNSLNNHILYSLSAHYSIAWFGESAWTLRLPALLCGVASIPALYHLGRQLASRPEAFLAALFMALNYQHVWFSQNARGYTGLLLGAVLASIFFIRLIGTAHPPSWLIVGYAVVAALATWMHLTALVVIAAHGLIWLALVIRPVRAGRAAIVVPSAKALLLAGLFTLVLYAPIFQQVTTQVEYNTRINEDVESLVRYQQVAKPWVLEEFGEGLKRSMPGGWPIILVVITALLTGIISYARQGYAVLGFLLLPALTTLVVIAAYAKYFFPRFIFMSFAFFVLIAVRGGFTIAPRILPAISPRWVLVIGILFALVSASMVPKAWKPKQDFTAAANYMAEHRLSGDAVVCLGLMKLPLATYLGMDCESVASLSDLVHLERQHERTWLLYTLPNYMPARLSGILERVQTPAEYRLVHEFEGTLRGGDIVLMLKEQNRPERTN